MTDHVSKQVCVIHQGRVESVEPHEARNKKKRRVARLIAGDNIWYSIESESGEAETQNETNKIQSLLTLGRNYQYRLNES